MKRALTLALLMWLSTNSASANFYSYVEWTGLSANSRAAYLAGVFDGFINTAADYGYAAVADHYDRCLLKHRLTTGVLATNVLAYAASKPELHGRSVLSVLISYLSKFCGNPPVVRNPKP